MRKKKEGRKPQVRLNEEEKEDAFPSASRLPRSYLYEEYRCTGEKNPNLGFTVGETKEKSQERSNLYSMLSEECMPHHIRPFISIGEGGRCIRKAVKKGRGDVTIFIKCAWMYVSLVDKLAGGDRKREEK